MIKQQSRFQTNKFPIKGLPTRTFPVKEYIYLTILSAIPLILFLYQRSGGYLAGSSLDWITQHSVFPTYFRELFWKSGNIFPQYAAEIGGGQNIWNFAYYGLYNPLFLLSFLLPGVEMSVYMQGISLLGQIANGILCYVWLKKHFEKEFSFYATFFLILAAPVIYHSSTQIMFVDYMPFLLMTLIGYDRYKEREKYGVMVAGVFCMILTSFYFSIGGLLVLFFYGLCDLNWERVKSLLDFIRQMWHRFYPVLFGVALSLFYLIPIYCAMQGGRSSKAVFSLKELLLPDVAVTKYLYSPYGIGVSAVAIIAIATGLFYKKCMEKWLSIVLVILLLCPAFEWLLNGGLYIRAKALIPFLPLVCYVLAAYFQKMKSRVIPKKWVAAGYVLAGSVLLCGLKEMSQTVRHLLYLDLFICAAVLLISMKLWKNALCIASAAVMVATGIYETGQMKSKLMKEDVVLGLEDTKVRDTIQTLLARQESQGRVELRGSNEKDKENINRVLAVGQNLTSCYSSIQNSLYSQFRKELGLPKSTRNELMENVVDDPIFLRIMGVKYLIGNAAVAGYQLVQGAEAATDGGNDTAVYENQAAAPLFYLTNQTISAESYKKKSWAQKQLTLLEAAVIKDSEGTLEKELTDAPLQLASYAGAEGEVTAQDGELSVRLAKGFTQKLAVAVPGVPGGRTLWNQDEPDEPEDEPEGQTLGRNQYLFISFTVDNLKNNQDVSVSINGQKNKLTAAESEYYNNNTEFHYTCPLEADKAEITVTFGKGTYNLKNIQCQVGSEDTGKNQTLYQNPVLVSPLRSGDGYEGKIDAKEDTCLVTSIPYDSNFRIYVDGKKIDSQKVNSAFLGAKIEKGTYELRIVYQAPGSIAGKCVSMLAVLVLVLDCVRRRFGRGARGTVRWA
ncbi:MAG: YfhO family protein [Hespellia sp.]|nr:YfhO family protein [Hespellia sp.]